MEIIQLICGAVILICGVILGGSWFIECLKMNPDDMFPGDEEEYNE